ncbi:flagellar P-ring protein precursor FlgI [Methylopila capsulata]|uniref:Flagellar P-ring protein n=1 Tax=Methylopila capsulata TaxID=61654 RepID=A0A9W6IRX9_9HYPH|nr:flagellar basal body P-ring protein FlgI [Methylopila capsulata]MBM7851397.1 flagellar P-ring protein precursor FlgI [Methylopila capsulata]GLK54454.1 flagellar P-ring protein 1 [Methylopila capsulata]
MPRSARSFTALAAALAMGLAPLAPAQAADPAEGVAVRGVRAERIARAETARPSESRAGPSVDIGGRGGATSRIKDLTDVEGVRENQLVGYGLVVGLNGTGDSLNAAPFTKQSLQSMLERLGVNTRGATLRTKNVAAVMVTANLPAFGTQGTRIDVTVSALGDATSLQGGTLIVTPLMGADGEVYSVAQGSVAVIGFNAQGEAAQVVRGVPTTGRISNGGLIEREIPFTLANQTTIRLALRNPDLTTGRRIASAINSFIGPNVAEPIDPATVALNVPKAYHGKIIQLLTEVEQLRVEPDQIAKIVIDERSGIIVMGQDVRVSTVAVAQGNLTVTITEDPVASQPEPFSNGETVVTPRTTVSVDTDANRRLAVLREGVNLRQLVDGLNAIGVGPRDLIAILQAIKAAGALQAEIEVM